MVVVELDVVLDGTELAGNVLIPCVMVGFSFPVPEHQAFPEEPRGGHAMETSGGQRGIDGEGVGSALMDVGGV